jgi:hypothetical protein
MKDEKVYITRDEGSKIIWVWLKPSHGNWSPHKMKDCDMTIYQREDMDIDRSTHYLLSDFKKKFGMIIKPKTKQCVHLPYDLLHNEDYKLISNDPNRKQ